FSLRWLCLMAAVCHLYFCFLNQNRGFLKIRFFSFGTEPSCGGGRPSMLPSIWSSNSHKTLLEASIMSFSNSRNRVHMSAPGSPSKICDIWGLSFSRDSNTSNSLKSFWGSFLLRAPPSPKRKNTTKILSEILMKHSGQTRPSMKSPRTFSQSLFSENKTFLITTSKC
ncbi:hypothetical protein VIGAN_02267900, partial [Vigna angularis var. angularis]